MKKPKINSFKSVINFSFIIILLTSACGQSGNTSKTKTEDSTAAKTVIAKPEMDIQTAVISGNLEIIKQHIEAKSDINQKDQMSGSTPLISAITFGKTTIAKALINAKADLAIKNNDGSTALHAAAFFGRVEIVQMLIDAKADKTLKNNFSATPRETVLGSFTEVKPIYKMLQQQLAPLGLQLDLNELEKARPVIAMMLQ